MDSSGIEIIMGRKSLRTDRRKEIINAFYRTAKKQGLHNVSIGKLAAAMDMNPSLIIHYFKTKEELVFGLIEYILDRYKNLYVAKKKDGQPSIEVLHDVLDNLFSRKWNKLVDDDVFYNCFTLVFRNPRIREKYKALHDSLRQMLAEILDKCKEDGYLFTGNTYQTADLIFLFVEGAYYYLSMTDDPEEYEQKMTLYKNQALEILDLYHNTINDKGKTD